MSMLSYVVKKITSACAIGATLIAGSAMANPKDGIAQFCFNTDNSENVSCLIRITENGKRSYITSELDFESVIMSEVVAINNISVDMVTTEEYYSKLAKDTITVFVGTVDSEMLGIDSNVYTGRFDDCDHSDDLLNCGGGGGGGRPGGSSTQVKQFRDAMRDVERETGNSISKDQERRVHDEIRRQKADLDYRGLKEFIKDVLDFF